ncbi:SDR family oxidoreductase [Streptomyces nodosus]|uniref:SDR family oxidoreductase n=1 Tax=Streptomyces nodosus TaxID=40318 RepID=A0A0B5DL39_9ACTN|nr:SDR family oxidoreductase [Streptomyces nodosus]AJE44458.1 short-chain dehydrogenase [Streptomyces nodosus]MBB4796113.1 NAD(P)-dependent dehydrogenase (short-subunit alcohol dehydrogenase family) [Streptomyces nodosus]QEV42943.1 SDR family oxidoreductase [Streptomyces nodosus]
MSGRSWFITGVTSGLGRQMATRLLEGGDRVAGTGRNTAALEEIAARYGDAFWPATLDVTDTAAVKDTIDRAAAALGNIDVAVNNAGYGMFGAAEEFTDEQIAHHLATNLTGSIAVARSVLPHLRANGGGRIVQISTYGGQSANPGGALYSAGKFGVEGFMEALAAEVAPFGIGVSIIEPGGTATGFRRNAVFSKPLAAYDDTPAAMVRGLSGSTRPSPGDPAKVVAAIIAATETEPAPLRVVLGSDSFRYVHQALANRLADVTRQHDSAAAVDITAQQDSVRSSGPA